LLNGSGAIAGAIVASVSIEGGAMPDRYDLAVIGAGMGGVAVASRAAGLGARVAVIEEHKVGGT
jgi:glutathione reductase (NADPH)